MSLGKIFAEDREKDSGTLWQGTFSEYLEKLKDEPTLAKLAHARIFEMIKGAGVRKMISDDPDPRIRKLFRDDHVSVYPFFEDFFGIEQTIAAIVRYFRAAASRGEESRQVLYLMGPVGSGKSSLVERVMKGLEESPPFYAIKNCPMFEEPLHLVPRHLRSRVAEELNLPGEIEGDLCPVCRYHLKNDFSKDFEKVPIEQRRFSKRSRVGLSSVPPVDPNNQDTSVLIGSEDISKLDLYSTGDPRVLELNGALNVGNRGAVEFIEVFKNETEYLHAMITATQEKVIPAPGRHGLVHVDTVIMAHSNEAEWQKFKADHTNQAILDRIVIVKIPYTLRFSAEAKIYQKILRRSEFSAHIAPHTLDIAALFAVLSRLEPNSKCDLLTKAKIYNGEDVIQQGKAKKMDYAGLRQETVAEGMSGISTRFVMKALDEALADAEGCINPINVREALVRKVQREDFPDDVRKFLLEILQNILHKEYLKILETEITKAFVYSYRAQAETLFQNYLDHAEGFVNKTKVKDAGTKEELVPDEEFLKSIEEHIGITGSAAENFRQEVAGYFFGLVRRGQTPNYESYAPLKEAIEKKLSVAVKEMSRIITKARARDKEQTEKYNVMEATLLDQGYCKICVDVVLKYAANNLWRD